MATCELNEQIQRLAKEGIAIDDDLQSCEGIAPFLLRISKLDYLQYSGQKRDQLKKLADAIHQLIDQWQTDYPPLFAVTGLKNAGKSSLVKTFLSDEGRSRTPTGNESAFATRRYVFWLPESMRTSGQFSNFESMLADVFGNKPEYLSTDPEIASQQYREDLGFKGMRRPLISYDSNLDSWNVGIVDCPDIQTGNGKDDDKLASAKEMLEKTSRLCASFLIIGQHENLEQDVFWQIIRMVQGIGNNKDNFLIVNKCPPKSSTLICDELSKLSRRNGVDIDGLHLIASYNFKIRGAEEFCVKLSNGQLPDGSARGDEKDMLDALLPTFFVCDEQGPHPPEAIPRSRLLQVRVQTLPSGDLVRQFRLHIAEDLRKRVISAQKELDAAADETRRLVVSAYREIIGCLLDAMTRNDSITPLQNPKLAQRQLDLLIEEAPLTIKASLKISRTIRNMLTVGAKAVLPKAVRSFLDGATSMLQRQGVELDTNSIARSLAGQTAFARVLGPEKTNAELASWLSTTFKNFLAEFDCEVEYLRPLVREHYEKMSVWGKVKAHGAALTTIALLIIAAVFAPIDGGGSLWGVSMLEGFLIAGGASAAELFQASFNIRNAEKPLVEGQLAFLTAGIARKVGLPSIDYLDHSIEIERNHIIYKLRSTAMNQDSGAPRVLTFRTQQAFIFSILEQLKQFHENTSREREGTV